MPAGMSIAAIRSASRRAAVWTGWGCSQTGAGPRQRFHAAMCSAIATWTVGWTASANAWSAVPKPSLTGNEPSGRWTWIRSDIMSATGWSLSNKRRQNAIRATDPVHPAPCAQSASIRR